MSGPRGFVLPHYQASSSSSQFNHPGEQKDGPVGGRLKMGAASHPGAVPGRWKDPNPLFTGVSNVASAEGILPSPTPQNSVLLSKEQVIEYVQDQFGPTLQKFGRPVYKKPYDEAVDRVEFPKGYKDRIDKGDFKFPEAAKKGMAVDQDPFPADFGANMVHVDMRGAPRTAPRQKISLGAPSQAAKGKQILHDSDNSPDDHPSPIWEETPSLSPRRLPQKRVSVFNHLQPTTHEVQKQMSSLVITAPQEDRPRMVKPPGLAQGIPTPPPIPPKRSSAPQHVQKKPRIEYRPVQKHTSQRVESSFAEVPKARKPVWKDILAKPRSINIRSLEDMLVVQEETPVAKVSSSLANLPCNMVFVLPIAFIAKEGQPSSMDGDVEASGDTPEISSITPVATIPVLKASAPEASDSQIPSIVVLKDEPTAYRPSPVASVLFEKPDPLMTQHLRPLYIQGHLDGIPVSRILVDNGSAANLMPRFMLVKLGKGDQDLLPSSASISDFAGGITTAQDKRPFLASSNHADAKLYDNEISPVKFTGTDKFGMPTAITLSTQTSVDEFKAIYKQLVGPLLTEINRPSTPLLQAISHGSSSNSQ
ncbi:hypothetical protein Vadar_019243 [Vaccinium darrowii]|uniref:Uncharacterized protein n=1 Tax=Vaccinium darrowii TaxID=229202 RepID=A0ACB7Y0K4_9ERIC|nr:hypothetical protein Vadar_019243 [Vaccinium darrowii]